MEVREEAERLRTQLVAFLSILFILPVCLQYGYPFPINPNFLKIMSMAVSKARRIRAAVSPFLLSTALLFSVGFGNRVWSQEALFTLTILHHSDGESKLIDAGPGLEDFGGIARFAALVKDLKKAAKKGPGKHAFVLISSGDNFLAGPEFNASLEAGRFFDAIALEKIKYDALVIGNHEFDFGPEVLAGFIRAAGRKRRPFISANLDFLMEPGLQGLAEKNRIVGTRIVKKKGERIGIIGLTTPQLPFISSPRNVKVNPDLVGVARREVDKLLAAGVNKIILASHLQSIEEDIALAPLLRGVDVMISGGGDDILANPGDLLVPGDEDEVFGPYPIAVKDADGNTVYIVATAGDYKYVGRLIISFDAQGRCIAVSPESGPLRVAGGDHPDAVEPRRKIRKKVTDPVVASVENLANNIIGTSQVPLDGRRTLGVRVKETNYGDLIADAILATAAAEAGNFGAPVPDIALINGGGIRNNNVVAPGPYSELDTFDALPFADFVAIVADIPPVQFKEVMENAVSRVEFVDGRFAQISGFELVWDANGTPEELDGNGNVITPGTRVVEIVLKDGTEIVKDGQVVAGAPSVNIATSDFLARGGDRYPFRGKEFSIVGVSDQQALVLYVTEVLAGAITAAQYPEGGDGRITRLN